MPIRVTELSNIRWFEKFNIRLSNIKPSKQSWIFYHQTGSIIEQFDQSNILIFNRGSIFDIRLIEYLKDSKRFDIRY